MRAMWSALRVVGAALGVLSLVVLVLSEVMRRRADASPSADGDTSPGAPRDASSPGVGDGAGVEAVPELRALRDAVTAALRTGAWPVGGRSPTMPTRGAWRPLWPSLPRGMAVGSSGAAVGLAWAFSRALLTVARLRSIGDAPGWLRRVRRVAGRAVEALGGETDDPARGMARLLVVLCWGRSPESLVVETFRASPSQGRRDALRALEVLAAIGGAS